MSAEQGYCLPSMGEPCGACHRCGPTLTLIAASVAPIYKNRVMHAVPENEETSLCGRRAKFPRHYTWAYAIKKGLGTQCAACLRVLADLTTDPAEVGR